MSSCLRNSRSVLCQLLRHHKPAHPLLTCSYHASTHIAHRWYRQPQKVAAAALLSYGAVSILPDAGVVALGGAFSYEETVPYTNRVHRVIRSPADARKLDGYLDSDNIKKNHGDDILDPSDPNTIRVRRIANDLIRGIHHVLLTGTGDPSLKGKAAPVPPQTEHLEGLNWEVFVVRDDSGSAYGMYNGKIVICTGLLNSLDTDAEIAAFLAHEMGHIVARHLFEFYALVELHIPEFLSKLLPYNRRKEIEADHIGVMLLAAAGFDPRVAPRIYQKRGETRGDSEMEDYFGSHPSYQTRARLLSQGRVMEEALKLYHKQVGTT